VQFSPIHLGVFFMLACPFVQECQQFLCMRVSSKQINNDCGVASLVARLFHDICQFSC
jgi:hypothetical protein